MSTSYFLLAPFKLIHAIVYLLWVYVFIRRRFHTLSPAAREDFILHTARRFLGILGLKLKVQGQSIRNGLLVANHASWCDILVLHASSHCRFVSKSEVTRWPIIGTITAETGNIFVKREKRGDSHRVIKLVAQKLLDGGCVTVFPEGKTGDGHTLNPFHPNLIESALLTDKPVQPVGIQFMDARTGARSFAPCYRGRNESMLASVWRTICTPHLMVCVRYGAPQNVAEKPKRADRRVWAQELHEAVAALLTGEQ